MRLAWVNARFSLDLSCDHVIDLAIIGADTPGRTGRSARRLVRFSLQFCAIALLSGCECLLAVWRRLKATRRGHGQELTGGEGPYDHNATVAKLLQAAIGCISAVWHFVTSFARCAIKQD